MTWNSDCCTFLVSLSSCFHQLWEDFYALLYQCLFLVFHNYYMSFFLQCPCFTLLLVYNSFYLSQKFSNFNEKSLFASLLDSFFFQQRPSVAMNLCRMNESGKKVQEEKKNHRRAPFLLLLKLALLTQRVVLTKRYIKSSFYVMIWYVVYFY